jgi:hypothetical protein
MYIKEVGRQAQQQAYKDFSALEHPTMGLETFVADAVTLKVLEHVEGELRRHGQWSNTDDPVGMAHSAGYIGAADYVKQSLSPTSGEPAVVSRIMATVDPSLFTPAVPLAPTPPETVTRLEVISEAGRVFTRWNTSVALSYQDAGRTLKVYVTPSTPEPPDEKRDRVGGGSIAAAVRAVRSDGITGADTATLPSPSPGAVETPPLAAQEEKMDARSDRLWEQVVAEANKGDIEEMLSKLGDYFAADADLADHPAVKAILTDLSETMSDASLDYYASTK